MSKTEHSLFASLISGIRWTFLHKVVAAGAGFGISILSARLLGEAGYGALQYVLAVLQMVLVFGAFGLNQVIVRETAFSTNANDWQRCKGAMAFALPTVGVLTAIGAFLGALSAIWPVHPELVSLFIFGFFATLARQLAMPFIALLNGLRKIALTGFGETVRNLLLIGMLTVAFFIMRSSSVGPESIMVIRMVAAMGGLVTVLVLAAMVLRRLPGDYFGTTAKYEIAAWIRQGASLVFVAGAGVVFANSDIVMIGAMIDASSVGPYHAASRAADLTAFALAITITPLGPIIAKLHGAGQFEELRATVRLSTRINLAVGLIVAATLAVFAASFLSLFGLEFTKGVTALRILVAAQLINVAVGPVQLLLVMTGHHKFAAIGVASAAVANVLLNAVLIPKFGIEGAAIGTASSVVLWNILLLVFVRRYIWSNSRKERK